MSHIEITPSAWAAEKLIAERSLTNTGHLPTGDELGGKFWDMVRTHYIQAVDTGHLARFEANHCPFVDEHETVPTVTSPVAMNAPPCSSNCQVPSTPPAPPGSGSVPEPSGIALMGLGISLVFAMLKGRARKRAKRRPEFDRLESRDLMSGVASGSYASGTAKTGPARNAELENGPLELYVNGSGPTNLTVSGTLDYQGGSNYSGTLAIHGTKLEIAVSGPEGNGLMNYTFTAGSLKGDSGTVDIAFSDLPSTVSEYTIGFDALPHRTHSRHR